MNFMMFRRTCIFLLIISAARVSAQDTDEQLQNIFEEHKLMGMAAVAVCHDSVVYSGYFGTADHSRNIAVTDSTLFRIASISKTVTATALMILYEKGLFNLDADISSILGYKVRNPYFPDVAITPRMLLSHTSGIQDGSGYSKFIMDSYYSDTIPHLSALLTDTGFYYTSDLWQNKKPGTYFFYCNLNFGIIGTLIEKLSGQRFDVFCKQNILEPLGIKGRYRIQDIRDINNVAVLYRGDWQPQADNFKGVMPGSRDLDKYVIGSNALIFSPHAGLRISATDLAKFMMMHMDGGVYQGSRILKDSTVKLMHRKQWIYKGSNGDDYYGLFRNWGLGMQITSHSSGVDSIASFYPVTGHIGEAYGLVGDMFFNDDNNFGMIFLTNGSAAELKCSSTSGFYDVEEDVLSSLFETAIQPCLSGSVVSKYKNEYESGQFMEPAEDKISIRYYLSSPGIVYFNIYNSFGEKVSAYCKNFESGGRKQLTIFTKDLENGLYYVIIKSSDNSRAFKFNIER
jgi:CubicO group peptidase (beta-lactamase class C family)